jgi:hypothetical protein
MPNRLLTGVVYKLVFIVCVSMLQPLRPGTGQPAEKPATGAGENQAI